MAQFYLLNIQLIHNQFQLHKNLVTWDGTSGNTLNDSGIAQSLIPNYCVDSGSANAVVVTPSPAFTEYVSGMTLLVKINAANTGAMTINVNSLGTKNIKRPTPSGLIDLVSGSVAVGGIIMLVYDGTQFQINGTSEFYPDTDSDSFQIIDGYAKFADQKTSGTAGGASSAGWNTRTLNTIIENSIDGCSFFKI